MKSFPYHLSEEQRHRFIGGRRRYNAERHYEAINRRWQIIFYWAEHPMMSKADLARHFGVSRATITRDVKALQRQGRLTRYKTCPVCKRQGMDTGPDVATLVEVVSDLKRAYTRLGLL